MKKRKHRPPKARTGKPHMLFGTNRANEPLPIHSLGVLDGQFRAADNVHWFTLAQAANRWGYAKEFLAALWLNSNAPRYHTRAGLEAIAKCEGVTIDVDAVFAKAVRAAGEPHLDFLLEQLGPPAKRTEGPPRLSPAGARGLRLYFTGERLAAEIADFVRDMKFSSEFTERYKKDIVDELRSVMHDFWINPLSNLELEAV